MSPKNEVMEAYYLNSISNTTQNWIAFILYSRLYLILNIGVASTRGSVVPTGEIV